MKIAIPTLEEISLLQSQTANNIDLFNSNLFKLQADDHLKSLNLRKKSKALLDTQFTKLQATINQRKTYELDSVVSQSKKLKHRLNSTNKLQNSLNIKIPSENYLPAENTKIALEKPASVELIFGPTKLRKPVVVIKLPTKALQNKDNFNNRYFLKKEVYTVWLDLFEFSVQDFDVKIVPANDEKWHKFNRFYENKSNLQQKYLLGERLYSNQEEVASPAYNDQILSDMLFLRYNEFVKTFFEENDGNKSMMDGLRLLTSWCINKRLSHLLDGFKLEFLLIHLAKEGLISSSMPAYHVVKTFFKYFSDKGTVKKEINKKVESEKSEENDLPNQIFSKTLSNPEIDISHVSKKPLVLVDPFGHRNVLFKTRPTFWQRFCHECSKSNEQHSSAKTSNSSISVFSANFYLKENVVSYYDCLIELKQKHDIINQAETYAEKLKIALGDRIKLVCVEEVIRESVRIVCLGVVFDEESYGSQNFSVIKCDFLGNSIESKQFREFWGDKSELRRFADGSTRETVIFENIQTLIKFVIKRHAEMNVNVQLIDEKPVLKDKIFKDKGREVVVKKISPKVAYDDLSKLIHICDKELPLKVMNVMHNSDLVSGACHENATESRTIDVIVELEKSAKWPEDLAALQRCKVAFLTELGDKLLKTDEIAENEKEVAEDGAKNDKHKKQQHGKHGKHGKNNKKPENTEDSESEPKITFLRMSTNFETTPQQMVLLVGYKKQYVFRIELVIQNEKSLYEKSTGKNGMVQFKPTRESVGLARRTEFYPRARGILRGQDNLAAFNRTVLLFKKWISSYKLSNHFSDLCIQLLVAGLLVNESYSTAQCGFMKALKAFFEFDFLGNMLVVNPQDDAEFSLLEVKAYFTENREILPALFISTPVLPQESPYSDKISFGILQQAQKFAKLTFDRVENGANLSEIIEQPVNMKFNYNLLVSTLKTKNKSERVLKLDLVRRLEKAFSGYCTFFSGDNGSEDDFIGVLMSGFELPEELKAKHMRMVTFSVGSYQFNLDEFKESLELMANGRLTEV